MPADAALLLPLFAAYGEAFDDADAETVADLFAYPAVIWQFGEGHHFADSEELVENVEALIEAFDEAGIVLTIPEVRRAEIAGEAAFATVRWRQEDRGGETLHAFTCHYLLHRVGESWRIAAVINAQPDAEG